MTTSLKNVMQHSKSLYVRFRNAENSKYGMNRLQRNDY